MSSSTVVVVVCCRPPSSAFPPLTHKRIEPTRNLSLSMRGILIAVSNYHANVLLRASIDANWRNSLLIPRTSSVANERISHEVIMIRNKNYVAFPYDDDVVPRHQLLLRDSSSLRTMQALHPDALAQLSNLNRAVASQGFPPIPNFFSREVWEYRRGGKGVCVRTDHTPTLHLQVQSVVDRLAAEEKVASCPVIGLTC